MSSQQLLLDITLTLNSAKKKEKLSTLEKLCDLLNQEGFVKNLHRNSKAGENNISWDILFIRVNNAVLSLVDESSAKSRQICDKHIQIAHDIISQLLQKSFYKKCLGVSPNLIASSVLVIFESALRIKILGSVYLNLFNKYVMSERRNWCQLKEEHWIGMKNICKNHFSNPPQGIQNVVLLQMLIDIIRFSSKNCQISHKFLNLFAFLKEVYASNKKFGSDFESILLHLTNTLCLQLAVEFRYSVCEFMEYVFDFIKHFHEKKNPDKNTLVYHFFMTTLNIHNPSGLWENKIFYASNIKKWKSQIREIFFLCFNEVKLILKNPNEAIVDSDLLNLFVDVYHLVSGCSLENNLENEEADVCFDEPGPSNKRRCSSEPGNSFGSKAKLIKLESLNTLLSNLNSSDVWFWLKVLEILLVKYPLCLRHEYGKLVEFLYSLICEKKNVENTKCAIRCLHTLLELENCFNKEMNIINLQWLDDMWNRISTELIRSLCTEACSETHALIRSLITHYKLQDIEPLIGLYCTGTLKQGLENFKTLCAICQHCILPEVLINEKGFKNKQQNCGKVKIQLLNWLLQGEEQFPSQDLAKVLISLILKKFEEDIVISIPKDDVLISQNNINDFCEFITHSFLTIAFKNLKFLKDSNAAESAFEIRIESNVKKKLFEQLEKQYKTVITAVSDASLSFADKLKALKDCLWFVELICHLLSHFECGNDNCEDCSFLINLLNLLLPLCSTESLNLLKVQYFDLTPFCKLYGGSYHFRVQKRIREPELINLDLLQYLFELFEDYSSKDEESVEIYLEDRLNSLSRFSQLIKNPKSILHFEGLSKREKLIVNVVETLCQYVTVCGFSDCNYYQTVLSVKLVKDLASEKIEFNTTSNFYFQLVLRVVCCFTKHDGITAPVLNDCLDLMQTVFSSKASDFEMTITGLQVLKDFTAPIDKVGDADTHSKYKRIIEGLRNVFVVKKNCGVKTTCKFIELLGEICKTDLEGDWKLSDDSSSSILEEIIKFLKHPYNEVKLTAAQYVGSLFVLKKNSKESTKHWQKKILKKLFEVLRNDSEKCLGKEKGCESEYSNRVISSVSLISWASVICLSPYWRKKALFYLIYLGFLKKFRSSEVEETLRIICAELKIDSQTNYISRNLFYLFYKWTKNDLSVEDFPFYLLGYKTVDDFLSNRFPVLVSINAERGRLDMLDTLSSKLKTPKVNLVKKCHSELLAFILPGLSENVNSDATRKIQKLKRFIDGEVGPKTSLQLLTESIDRIIYWMIQAMHDPSYLLSLADFWGNLKDDKNPLGYSGAQILETLENLGTHENKPLLGKIALEVPSVIEKILRYLLEDIVNAVIYEEKVFAFYKYIFFVEIVSKATRKGFAYRNINIFIIRDVVYSLSAILRKAEDEILTDMACACFQKLGDSYLEEFSSVIGEFLPKITTALTPAAKRSNKKALEVLRFFILGNFSKLESQISLLDIFPAESVFIEINEQIIRTQVLPKTLKNTINQFISSGRNKNSGCRIEGLRSLGKMLSDNKVELKEMYEELKSLRGFSEDCKNSFLHQLICMLVELTSDENTIVRTEAAKCLGELGPSDLTTLVLRPENNFAVSKSSAPAVYRLLMTALGILSDLLISDSFEVKKASSKALYCILSTVQGKEIFDGAEEKVLENVEYLTPFARKSAENWKVSVRKEKFLSRFDEGFRRRGNDHEKWIVRLMETLLESLADSKGVMDAFVELIRVNWQFAENIFPVCLDLVLSFKEKKCNDLINENIRAFFTEHFHYNDKSPGTVNKTSVQCILNVVDYIRMQRNHEGSYQGFDLDMNFLHVAKAALHCSAFFTSVFYAELWFEDKKQKHNFYMDVNMICELFPEEGFAMAEILRKCHFEIGNLDGIHGCGYMHILNSTAEIQHHEHLKNWNLSMVYHDAQLSQGNGRSEVGLFHSLEQFGMYYTLNRLIKTRSETPELTAMQYKCAANLLDWSQLDSSYKRKNNLTPDCFEKGYYFALKAFHDEDIATFQIESHRTRKIVLNELAGCSLESSKNLYLFMTELQKLKELEEFAAAVRGSRGNEVNELFEKWDRQDSIKCSEFKLVESILSNRAVMIRDTLERGKGEEMKKCLQALLCRTYYKLTVGSRREKKYETAIRALDFFGGMSNAPEDVAGKMKVEKARILWERGDREIGRFLLSHFLKKNEITGDLKLKSLRIYGDWMATTKSENSREIIENYYLKSIGPSSDSRSRIHSFASLAKFAHGIYEQFNEYLTSPLFEIKQSLISTQQGLASELRQELGRNQNREKRVAYQIAAKQSAIDENEIKNSKAERDSYLSLALKYYLLSLREGEKYNLVVFRVISLWLSNSSHPEVIRQLQKLLHHIPSYKFLCLLPQLVPRMADVCLISGLIEKILQDHPYHTLPLLFALSNSYEDLKYNGAETGGSNPRVLAASSMIKKFESSKKLERAIIEMRRFASALIELANYSPPDRGRPGSPVTFPDHLLIRRIGNLTSVPVPSLHIPYNKKCTYDNVVGIRGFQTQYHLVGGINLPKRITCIGSDGIGRPLLVKGKDDLRQDAVMQQVFTIMNFLLYQNKDTSKRKLVIRTYKVVPLSQRSGVIEWCENTQPLSLYLTGADGKSGAHKKYFPNDISPFDCRTMIRAVFAKPLVTNEEKLKVFLDVCKQLHPVFHNFFIEKFPAAGVWFERRLAYIHSVATSSMIGYILGLGDRHVHNILIDNATAEVIHIDLGIAFEQGKTLPTPETVPFRLTRDIVDGMGSSGVEGDFRISCIKAMEVLRENQDTILTLLEVLLYDPLYTWTITPEKAYSIQNQTETSSTTTEKSSPDPETNKMAERALIRLKQKFQGTEAGVGAATVEGQVRILINEARDPNNLCRLFHGWQAYL